MFTEREIERVRTTWREVAVDPDAAAALFYGRLFEAAPDVKPLFTGDMKLQGRKLMQMISIAVNAMDRIEEIVPSLQELGKHHEAFGTRPEHYPVVGQTLLGTLATALGESFDAETEAAWTKTYGALADVMMGKAP